MARQLRRSTPRRWTRYIAAVLAGSLLTTAVPVAALAEELPATETAGPDTAQGDTSPTVSQPPVGAAATVPAGFSGDGGNPADLLVANRVIVDPGVPLSELTTDEKTIWRSQWNTVGPAFGADVQVDNTVRPGGQATVTIPLVRRANPGVRAKDVQVRITAESGRISAVKGTRWSCDPGKDDTVCAYRRTVGSATSPSKLTADLAVREGARGKARVVVVATWKEQRIVNAIGGATGPVGTYRTDGWRPGRVKATETSELLPRLRMRTESSGNNKDNALVSVGSGTTIQDRAVALSAIVPSAAGQPVDFAWKQVGGPEMRLTDRSISNTNGASSVNAIAPTDLDKPARVAFRVRAASGGAALTRTVRLTVVPIERAKVTMPAGSQKEILDTARVTGKGRTYNNSRTEFTVESPGELANGRARMQFVAHSRNSRVKRVTWTQLSGPPVVMKKTGKTTAVVKGDSQAGVATMLATAQVAGRGTIERAELVKVGSGLTRTETASTQGVGARSSKTDSPLCAVATIGSNSTITYTFPGSAAVTVKKDDLGKNNSPKDLEELTKSNCDKSEQALTFTDAVLTYNGNTFRSLAGEISGEMLDLFGMKLKLEDLAPGAFKTAWVQKLAGKVDPAFTLDKDMTFQAKWESKDSKWGPLEGELVLDSKIASLPILPLPTGWTRKPTSLALATKPGKIYGYNSTVTLTQEYNAKRESDTENADGEALFVGELVNMNVSKLTAHAANLAVLTAADGKQVSFNGDAEIKDASGKWTGSVLAGATCPTDGCALIGGARLKNAQLSWSRESTSDQAGDAARASDEEESTRTTIAATGSLSVEHLGDIDVEGSFTDVGNWSLAAKVAPTVKRQVKSGVTLTRISGEIKVETPEASKDDPDPDSHMTFAIGGELEGFSVGNLTNGKLSGEFSNVCTEADQEAKKCDRSNLHLAIEAFGKLRLAGKDVDITARGIVDLAKDDLELTGVIGSAEGFGPQELNMKNFGITLTNNSKLAQCVANSDKGEVVTENGQPVQIGALAEQADPKKLMVVIGADAELTGIPVKMYGQYSEGGQLCMWGATNESFTKGGLTVDDAYVAYSTFEADITLPGDKKVHVAANSLNLAGSFALPGDQAGSVTGLSTQRGENPLNEQVTINLTFGQGLTSFSAKAAYQMARPWMMSGTPDNGLAVSGLELFAKFDAGSGSATIGFGVTGSYDTPGKNGVEASRTPVFATIDLEAGGRSGFQACLTVGVKGGQTIPNAFGIAEFNLSKMAIAGCLAGDPAQSSVAFNFEAQLPSSWTRDIAFINSPKVAFGFKLSLDSPCLVASVGDDRSATGPDTRQTVFDLAKGGFLTAKFLRIVIAPVGCTLPLSDGDQDEIDPGFAFAFDGQIIGADVYVNVAVGLKPFAVKASVELPAIETAGFSLTGYEPGTPLRFSIDTAAGKYTIDAAIELGTESTGARVRVLGDLDTKAKTLQMKGNGDVRLAAITLASADVVADVKWGSDPAYKANVNGLVNIFGIVTVRVGADLTYEDKKLKQFYLGVGVRANIAVASIDGTIVIEYCLGTLNDFQTVADNFERTKSFDNQNYCTRADNHKRLRVWGSVDLGFLLWKTHQVAVLYNTDNGQPVYEDYNVPTDRTPPAVPSPDDMARQASYTGIKCSWTGGQAGTSLNPETCRKTWIKPIQGIGDKACVASQQGVEWDPKNGANPPPTGVSKLQVNSAGSVRDLNVGGYCEMQVLLGSGKLNAAKPDYVNLGQVGCSRYTSGLQACVWNDPLKLVDTQVLVVPGTDNKPLGSTLADQTDAGLQQLVMNFAGEKKASDLPGFRKGTLANQQSNRCLDVPFGDSSKQLRIWDCNNTASQQFEYNPDTQQLKVLGKCLYRDDGLTWFYAKLQDCDRSSAKQRWELTDRGEIVSLAGGGYDRYVLEAYGTDKGSLVYVRDNKNRVGMKWYEQVSDK